MSVKMIGALLVLLSAYAMGSLFALRIKEQERWLKEIKTALFLLSGELEYRQLPFPEALERTGRRQNGRTNEFFLGLWQELKKREGATLQELWQQQAVIHLKDSPLTRQQREEFGELGVCFSETDRETRRNTLEFYLKRLEEDAERLRQTGADKAYLYRTLGMLGGMFLVILML